MEHIAAFLLVVGCSDMLSECRELPASTSAFETVQECQEALDPALSRFTTRVPQVFASCVAVDPAEDQEDPQLAWHVGLDGILEVEVREPATVLVASNSQSREKDYLSHD
jgi:hypothetical protein